MFKKLRFDSSIFYYILYIVYVLVLLYLFLYV